MSHTDYHGGWSEVKEYCPVCEEETPQERKYDDHERDSSNDSFHCLQCDSWYSGYTGKWRTPDMREVEG